VEGVIEGIEMVDGSYLGMGRGSGNTCLEQLLCFFKNPKFDVRPVMEVQGPPQYLTECLCRPQRRSSPA
jgi:isopropylmalate/homocitrate/citramalate synthase